MKEFGLRITFKDGRRPECIDPIDPEDLGVEGYSVGPAAVQVINTTGTSYYYVTEEVDTIERYEICQSCGYELDQYRTTRSSLHEELYAFICSNMDCDEYKDEEAIYECL